ncbi:hypothetical protein AAFF_G00124610 [Aldrovandia affinis]|uniref:Uncharacterized protein n=1 Tax=Aldrovandia affinis TaxID=143900 RepID=A0AAD7RRJ9_9TELE|nr:hypothetical protein AAFF_G00124610 [Aldrovandia affinis]
MWAPKGFVLPVCALKQNSRSRPRWDQLKSWRFVQKKRTPQLRVDCRCFLHAQPAQIKPPRRVCSGPQRVGMTPVRVRSAHPRVVIGFPPRSLKAAGSHGNLLLHHGPVSRGPDALPGGSWNADRHGDMCWEMAWIVRFQKPSPTPNRIF